MSLHDAVFQRISTRTYQDKQLHKENVLQIMNVLSTYNNVHGPFAHSFEFTFNLNDTKETNGKKIGTYGMLKNVPAFIGGVCENNSKSIIDFGYIFEHIILELTLLGFGTCWLGGTFKRKDYRRSLKDTEIIPAISPVGYSASKRSFIDRMLRSTAQSDNRLSFNELFLDPDSNPLQLNPDESIADCLKMVQKGPSASNKQPWRMIIDVENHLYHMFLLRTPGYAKPLKYDIQALDIGIALAHFEIGLKHHNIPYIIENIDQHPIKDNWEYITSFKQTT